MQNFSGRLYYDDADNNHLDVKDFIVRPDQISFTIDSVSAEYVRWSTSGIALKSDDGDFRAVGVLAMQQKVDSDKWDLRFRIDNTDRHVLFVEGHIKSDGTEYPFSGDLDLKSASR